MKKLVFLTTVFIILFINRMGTYASTSPVTYINNNYGYYVTVTDEVYLDADKTVLNLEESTVTLRDRAGNFTVSINCDKLDEYSLAAMRRYLNNSSLSDDETFKRAVDYKESYLTASYDYYKKDYQYGGNDGKFSESNIKVFGDYREKLYGCDTRIVLFNAISSDKFSSLEETHLNVMIPSGIQKTIYTISFTIKQGALDEPTIKKISNILKSFRVFYQLDQSNNPRFFSDTEAFASANAGIYPNLEKTSPSYTELANKKAGYRISFPSSFMTYRQNNIVDSFDYKSFKIDYNSYFHVSVSPAGSNDTAMRDRVDFLLKSYPGEIRFIEGGSEIYNRNNFIFLSYEVSDKTGDIIYIKDYFTVKNSRLYNLQLNSRLKKPGTAVLDEFAKIVRSFSFIDIEKDSVTNNQSIVRFINLKESFSFAYPEKWDMSVGKSVYNSEYGEYDVYKIRNSDFSGALDVSVAIGELTSDISYSDIVKYVTGSGSPNLGRYFKSYSAPYLHSISKPLAISHYTKEGATYIFKLINYLDEGERSRLCYSVDIVVNMKLYSLFISVSDYITENGKITNQEVHDMVNLIADSFELH